MRSTLRRQPQVCGRYSPLAFNATVYRHILDGSLDHRALHGLTILAVEEYCVTTLKSVGHLSVCLRSCILHSLDYLVKIVSVHRVDLCYDCTNFHIRSFC